MRNVTQKQSEREEHIWVLAGRLEFAVEKAGDRFTLIRTADVAPPVREEQLTLDQAERFLEIWKLRDHG